MSTRSHGGSAWAHSAAWGAVLGMAVVLALCGGCAAPGGDADGEAVEGTVGAYAGAVTDHTSAKPSPYAGGSPLAPAGGIGGGGSQAHAAGGTIGGGSDVRDATSDPGWLSTVQGRMADSEYQVVEGPDGLSFGSRAQNLRARFVDGGVRVEPRDASPDVLNEGLGSFAVTLRTVGIGREGAGAAGMQKLWSGDGAEPRIGACDATGRTDMKGECLRRVERDGDGFVEWFRGLRRRRTA